MLPWGARVTCYPWDARCSGYGSNLADWLTSSWLKVIEATRTVHAKVMMRLRAGCPLFWLRVAHERSRWLSNDVELLASPSSPRTGEQLENSTERLATVAGLAG